MSKQEVVVSKKTPQAKVRQAGRKKSRSGIKIGLFVLLLPFLGLLLPTCIVLMIFGLPTLLSLLVDRTKEKYLTVTTAALNLTGTLPALAELWSQGQSFETAVFVIGDAWYWTLSFGGAGFAWAIYMCMPIMVLAYFQASSSGRMTKLELQQAELIEFWGPEVAGMAEAESSDATEPTEPLSLEAPAEQANEETSASVKSADR